MKDGDILKEYLQIHDITVQAFRSRIPISITKLYKWFGMERFDNVTIAQVTTKGKIPIEIFNNKSEEKEIINNKSNQTTDNMKMENELLKEKIEGMRREMNLMNEMIEMLKLQLGTSSKRRSGS